MAEFEAKPAPSPVDALVDAFETQKGRLAGMCRRVSPADVDDILQDAVARGIQKIRDGYAVSDRVGFLVTLTKNARSEHRRRGQPVGSIDADGAGPADAHAGRRIRVRPGPLPRELAARDPDHAAAAEQHDFLEAVLRAIESAPDRVRAIINLVRHGRSVAAAARELGVDAKPFYRWRNGQRRVFG